MEFPIPSHQHATVYRRQVKPVSSGEYLPEPAVSFYSPPMPWRRYQAFLFPAGLMLALFLVYFHAIPRSFNTTYENRRFFDSDGEFIVRQFRQNSYYTHNDHLLYHVAARGLHRYPHALGLGTNPVRIHLFMSSLAGALGITLLFLAGQRLLSRPQALAAALAIGGCSGWWFFSSTIDTYLPCLAASILALILALRTLDHPSRVLHAAMGAAMGLAFLFRTDSFLLVSLGLVFLDRKNRRWSFFFSAAIAGLVVAGAGYALLAHRFYGIPWTEIPAWAMGGFDRPETRSQQTWGQWSNLSVSNIGLALVNQLFYTIALPHMASTRSTAWWSTYTGAGQIVQFIILIVWIGTLALSIRHVVGRWKDGSAQAALVFAVASTWMVSRTIFYAWWDPADPFLFAVMILPAFWLLLVLALQAVNASGSARLIRLGTIATMLLAIIIGLHNVRYLIIPFRKLCEPG